MDDKRKKVEKTKRKRNRQRLTILYQTNDNKRYMFPFSLLFFGGMSITLDMINIYGII